MIAVKLAEYIERVALACLQDSEDHIRSEALYEGGSTMLEDFASQREPAIMYAYVTKDLALEITTDVRLAGPTHIALIRKEDRALDGSKPLHTQLYVMTISSELVSSESPTKCDSSHSEICDADHTERTGACIALSLLGIQRVNKYLITPAIAHNAIGKEGGNPLIEGAQKKAMELDLALDQARQATLVPRVNIALPTELTIDENVSPKLLSACVEDYSTDKATRCLAGLGLDEARQAQLADEIAMRAVTWSMEVGKLLRVGGAQGDNSPIPSSLAREGAYWRELLSSATASFR
jgi:hypothetical protein